MRIEDILNTPDKISIDTRSLKTGDVFIAIKGEKFDGHDFVVNAFKKGASCCVVSRVPKGLSSKDKNKLVKVKSTINALCDIAKANRSKFDVPVIAITGSNGKTTTKDLVSSVLSSKYNVLKNETSKNNIIGLPLTLLKLNKRHDIAVLEMGMNHLGEIDRLAEIAKPMIGVVTNIGPSHLEFLGNLKNVFIAKSELLKRLPEEGLAILNKDDSFLRDAKGIKPKKIFFGIDKKCEFQAKSLSYKNNKWTFKVLDNDFELPLFGRHNIYNALVAILIARLFEIDFSLIQKSLASYVQHSSMRMEFKNIRGVEFLDDSYNSNPLSMECAIEAISKYETDGKKIVVTGDMLELGKKAKSMHRSLGKAIASSPVNVLIALGSLSKLVGSELKKISGKTFYHAASHSDASGFLKSVARPGDVVLVKGSRGMEMEKIIEDFKEV